MSSTELVGVVNREAAPAPLVRALDESGKPLRGVPITFGLDNGIGFLARTSVETDADGSATVGGWTLGHIAGPQSVSVRSGGRTHLVFTAVAEAGPVAQIRPELGNRQSAATGDTLRRRLLARVEDAFGNPIAGAPVTFTVISGSGSIENGPVASGPTGLAESGVWTLGPGEGEQQVRAASGTAEALFTAIVYGDPRDLQGRLAFVAERDGDPEIYSVDPDGGRLERLTTGGGFDIAPAWSPDGARIAFVSDRDGSYSIYVMNSDGSSLGRRGDSRLEGWSEPEWSPDGSAIVFAASRRDGWTSIATLDEADGRISFLTNALNNQPDTRPSWSPNGRTIAFVSDGDGHDLHICTMNADGTDQRLRVSLPPEWDFDAGRYQHPVWSPDGDMIAFVRSTIVGGDTRAVFWRYEIAVMSESGEWIGTLAWAGDTRGDELLDPGSLAWSPDGTGIAYSFIDCDLVDINRFSCSRARSIRYASLDGTRQGVLVPDAHCPSWRP